MWRRGWPDGSESRMSARAGPTSYGTISMAFPLLTKELDRGQLQLVPRNTLPGSEASVDPAVELPQLAAMTEDALVAGYRALRVFAHGTNRVRDPAQRAQQVRYEHLIDRFCLEHPLTMLCAYDAAVLGNSAVAELACVHALAHEALSPFQLCAALSADAALAGNVDVFCTDQLERALERVTASPPPVAPWSSTPPVWSSWTSAGCSPWIGTPRPRRHDGASLPANRRDAAVETRGPDRAAGGTQGMTPSTDGPSMRRLLLSRTPLAG